MRASAPPTFFPLWCDALCWLLGYLFFPGPLPPAWSSLRSLVSLVAGNNRLTGGVPAEWSLLTSLTRLDVPTNALNATLPVSLSALTLLDNVMLTDNQFFGSLPAQWSALTRLRYLGLGTNRLSTSGRFDMLICKKATKRLFASPQPAYGM